MPQLTKALIDKSEPKTKDYIIWDDIVKGFGCRVYPTKKTFIYRYRSPQDKRIISIKIGVYGSVTVEEARTQAKKFAHSVQIEKVDPKETKEIKEKTETLNVRQSLSFEEFLTIFLDIYPKQAKWKPSTFNRHQSRINKHILPFFGKKLVVDIKRKDILEFSDIFHKNKNKNKKCLDLLSTIFKQAALWEYRPKNSNPCAEVSKDADRKMERFLTEEELSKLQKILTGETILKVSPYTIKAIHFLIYTGCRKGEVLPLKWEEVDFDDCCLRLSDSKVGKRTIPLNNSAVKVLRNVQEQPDNPYVFCGKRPGAHLVTIQKTWQRICKQAGIKECRIHDIRHSFASFMIKNGLSLFEVSKLLGHSNISTTMRYSHLSDRELVGVANKGGKIFES
jgi:integrase